MQIGVDLGLLKDRILANFTYVRNRSSNQLLPYNLPSITGFTSIFQNFPATVQNTSVEMAINTINIKTNSFSWSTSLNVTIPRNKLLVFPNISESSYAGVLIVGQPIGFTRVLHYTGVDSETGEYTFEDIDGKPTTNPDYGTDRIIIINPFPKFYGGCQTH